MKHFGDAEILDLPVLIVEIVECVVLWFHEETRDVVVEFIIFREVHHLLLAGETRVGFLEVLLPVRVVEVLEVAEEDYATRTFLLEDYLVHLTRVVVVLTRRVLHVHLRSALEELRL